MTARPYCMLDGVPQMVGADEEKRLHVSTWSKIYQLPLQRCERYQNCR